MLRRLYNARGVLLAPLLGAAKTIQLDAQLYDLLNTLAQFDWTYLAVTDGRQVEIVKVVWVDHQIHIERGVDFTQPLDFDTGAEVYYTLTRQEILESYSSPLQLFYGDAITVQGTVVTYPEITFEIFGAGVLVGEDGKYVIGRKENAYGCCNGNNLPAPIVPPYIYITSRPYPIEDSDAYSATGIQLTYGKLVERVTDDTAGVELAVLEGSLWGGRVTTENDDDTVDTGLEVLEGSLWGGLVTISAEDDIVKVGLHLVGGNLWGSLVEYSHPPELPIEDHITVGLAVLGGSIT